MSDDFLQAKTAKAMREIEEQLRKEDRVAIGEARWEPDVNQVWHLVVDSVPVTTIKLLGRERVWELYEQAKRETAEAEDRSPWI